MTTEQGIELLLAERDIRRLVQNFCRGADRGDVRLMAAAFHEDAIDEHGVNPTKTAAELLESVPVMRAHMQQIQHSVTNHVIAIDGDYAEGEAYVLAYHRYEEDGTSLILAVGGRYLDKYERRAGEWKIAHRVCVEDWSVLMPAPAERNNALTGLLPTGAVGKDDPSVGFFRMLA